MRDRQATNDGAATRPRRAATPPARLPARLPAFLLALSIGSAALAQPAPVPPAPAMPAAGFAPPASPPSFGSSGTGEPSTKFLIPIVMAAMTPALQAGLGCVFDRLFSFMGSNPNPACVQPNQTAVLKPADGGAQAGVAAGGPTPAMPPADGPAGAQAQALAATPVLSFIVNKLSDGTPQATVTQTVQFADVQKTGGPLAFDIRTGEAFAILFSTSVPGRVRLINTDVDHVVSTSDVYEAMPAADNRMPRDWQGGIVMAGAKGTEYLDVEFTPCVSPRYATDPRVAMFQGLLPACSPDAATKRFVPAGVAGRGGPAATGAKAMVFPGSPSPGQPVALAPGDYTKGDGLTFRLTIDHR